MREALRAGERREAAMAEAAASPGGSPGPASAPSPRGSAGTQEDERCPGGPSPEKEGTAAELSKSINLELPEEQRLSHLLLSSFQFAAQKMKQILEKSEGFDPEAFAAKVQESSQEFQMLLQRLLQDGTLRNCVESRQGDSLDPALQESVAHMKELMASFSSEIQAWDQLLQLHLQRSQEASRDLELLRAGNLPRTPPQIPKSQILDSKPDYGGILRRHLRILRSLRLLVDEAQQAGKTALEFQRESGNFLRGLSGQLASRTFQKLQGSPVRRLLERKPQRALPAEGQ